MRCAPGAVAWNSADNLKDISGHFQGNEKKMKKGLDNMGIPMISCSHQEVKAMPDHPSKTAWEKENVVQITIKINRNTEPELYELFTREPGSKGALAKALMNQAIKQPATK